MQGSWRTGIAALAALMAASVAAVADPLFPWLPNDYSGQPPYAVDRSVILESSPVDPTPIERHYGDRLPWCNDQWALDRISWFFAEKESRFWNSPLQIQFFSEIREVAFRPWGYGKIPRRYCEAKAGVSDGKLRTVYYSIIKDGGFAGIGTGVEWCVKGLDRNWAYAPNCQAARP